jgi:hypothetical protein
MGETAYSHKLPAAYDGMERMSRTKSQIVRDVVIADDGLTLTPTFGEPN